MPTLVQFFTFIYAYGCDVLSRLLAVFHGSLVNSPTDTSVGEADLTSVENTLEQEAVDPGSAPNPAVALQLSTGEITFDDLMRVAVAYANEDLPDLPAIFQHEAPPAVEFPPSYVCKQIFGPPSSMYYDRRPMGNVTNYREVEDAVGFKLDVNMKLEGKPSRRTRRAKRAKANTKVKVGSGDKRVRFEDVPKVQVYGVDDPPALVVVQEAPTAVQLDINTASDTCPALELPTIAEPVSQAHAEHITLSTALTSSSPLCPDIASPPGTKESTVSPSTRRPCGQVRKSTRPSSRLPPPLPIPVPLPEPVAPCLVPTVLDSARRSPRRKLQDRLSALLEDSKATISALENINPKASTGTFSAVALEEGRTEIFVIGEDEDDEDYAPASKRSWRRASSQFNRILHPRPNGSIV
ncbi:hypothetical protein R3P38DRAFT_3088901 [Favolaschia claudopus]|uniref:Uncharacterized protein n=1 Tax=Favolaschia claudopus TaxID=2862362 RepID=A0AAV9ZSW6_9AGAR